MATLLINDFQTTVSSGINSSATTLTVAAAIPGAGASDTVRMRNAASGEIFDVTAGGNGTSWTIVRGVEDASRWPAAAMSASDVLEAVPTSAGIQALTKTTNSSWSIGTNPASAGAVRLPNDAWVAGRNAANSADLNAWKLNSSNFLEFGTNIYRSEAGYSDRNAWFAMDRQVSTVPSDAIPRIGLAWWNAAGRGTYSTPAKGITGHYISVRDHSSVVRKAISGAVNNGSGLIRITATGHGWSTGETIGIKGVLGTTEANGGPWTITVIDANTFDLQGSTFTNTYTSGGVAATSGNLYGLNVSVYPTVLRDNVPYDDVVGIVVGNASTNASKGTDCIYISGNSNFAAGDPEWISGVLVDCDADYAFRTGGPTFNGGTFVNGLRLDESTFTGLAIKMGNAHALGARNAAGSADITLAKLNGSNVLQLMEGGQNIAVWGTSATASNGSGRVVNLLSSSSSNIPEVRVENTGNSGSAEVRTYGKDSGGTVVQGRFGVNGGGPTVVMGSETNHNLVIRTNANRRMTIDNAGLVVLSNANNPSAGRKFEVEAGADANIGIIVTANSGTQSANLFEAHSSAHAVLCSIGPSGVLNSLSGLKVGAASSTAAGRFARTTDADGTFAYEAIAFSAGATVLSPASSQTIMVWRAPFACTVTNVRSHFKGGTSIVVNARRNQSSNHLSSNHTNSTADAWGDGGSVQNTAYAAGDDLEIMIVTVNGAVTEASIQVDFTRP